MSAYMKLILPLTLLILWLLLGCNTFGEIDTERAERQEFSEEATLAAEGQRDIDRKRDEEATAWALAEEEATINAIVEADLTRVAEEASLSDKETPTPTLSWDQAAAHAGEVWTVCGPVVSTAYRPDINGQPTWLNIGEDYPSTSRFQIVIWGEDRGNFPGVPEDTYRGNHVCATGEIELFRGVAQMELSSPASLVVP